MMVDVAAGHDQPAALRLPIRTNRRQRKTSGWNNGCRVWMWLETSFKCEQKKLRSNSWRLCGVCHLLCHLLWCGCEQLGTCGQSLCAAVQRWLVSTWTSSGCEYLFLCVRINTGEVCFCGGVGSSMELLMTEYLGKMCSDIFFFIRDRSKRKRQVNDAALVSYSLWGLISTSSSSLWGQHSPLSRCFLADSAFSSDG